MLPPRVFNAANDREFPTILGDRGRARIFLLVTRPSHYVRSASGFAILSVILATAALAQPSWLEPIRSLDAQGRTREALNRLEGDRARLSGDDEARLLYGVLLAKLGRTAEARELYQQLILERPDQPEAYNNLAVMHAAAGDYETAIEILKQGLATHPSYRTAYDNLTKVYAKLAGQAYSKALGDQRIDSEPLRLALINGMQRAAPSPTVVAAGPAEPAPRPTAVESTPQESQPAAASADRQGSAEPSQPVGEPAIWQAVKSWAAAWADQRVDAYLAFYADGFAPPDGSSRADWEALRRRRLEAPGFIRVSLALLELEQPAPDRAIARFVQSYESDRFRDTVTKVLELTQTEVGWRIVREGLAGETSG